MRYSVEEFLVIRIEKKAASVHANEQALGQTSQFLAGRVAGDNLEIGPGNEDGFQAGLKHFRGQPQLGLGANAQGNVAIGKNPANGLSATHLGLRHALQNAAGTKNQAIHG